MVIRLQMCFGFSVLVADLSNAYWGLVVFSTIWSKKLTVT